MRTFKMTTRGPAETQGLGKTLAAHLGAGDILCLTGELGTGKTTFVKGLAQGLKIPARRVNSPTFVVMNHYKGRIPLYHFDFYRLGSLGEIQAIGYEEFLYGEGIAVIEWADNMGELIPPERIDIFFRHYGQDERHLEFKPHGQGYEKKLFCLI